LKGSERHAKIGIVEAAGQGCVARRVRVVTAPGGRQDEARRIVPVAETAREATGEAASEDSMIAEAGNGHHHHHRRRSI
jgi:hypothetical protein